MSNEVEKKTGCLWHDTLKQGCGPDCDFKTLPYEKDAIIARIKEEMNIIKKLQITAETDVAALNKLMDKLYGVSIMGKTLQEKFDVSVKELKKIMGSEMSRFERMKLATKLAIMRKSRGK